jgi:beta-lactamase regulating signal transducer with metallopeptidase domain
VEATFDWLVALTLRSTVVLTAALGLAWLLRRSSAAARHHLLTLTALGLLAVPVLTAVLPRLELPIGPIAVDSRGPASHRTQTGLGETAVVTEVRTGTADATSPAPPAAPAPKAENAGAPSPRGVSGPAAAFLAAAVMAWLFGVVASLIGLGRALLRETRLLAASRSLSGRWLETLDEARRSFAVARRVRLLVSDAIETPLTGGWLRPAVLLPAIAESWTAERRLLVLQHELVHVVRGDGLRRLAWRLVAALYWFHPLARIAERRAVLVGEQACDEAVVRRGTRPSLYARHLVEIADALRGRPGVFASAVPMVERNQLERRVVMILDPSRTSNRGRGAAIASLAILAATVLCAAAAAPAQREREAAPRVVAPEAAAPETAPADPAPAPRRLRRIAIGVATQDESSPKNEEATFQHDIGDGQRLRARVVGRVVFDDRTGAIREMPRGSSVRIETRERGKGAQSMLITEDEGAPRYEWRLNGDPRPIDDDARAWLKEALEAYVAFREIGSIQGHVGSLRGQIGSIHGRIGSLQGRIGSIRGEEGSLQGKIGAIHGERGSLQGAIGSHRGAIANLRAARSSASDELRKMIDREIEGHEAAIKKIEAERDDGALARRLAEAEAELSAFQKGARGKIAEIERQIAAIQSENVIAQLEKEIEDFRAPERIAEVERRVAPAVERLKALVRKLGG